VQLPSALFIFIQQVAHLLNGQGRIPPIQRFLTFPLLLKWTLIGEAATVDRAVGIIRVMNASHRRSRYIRKARLHSGLEGKRPRRLHETTAMGISPW
jgi:hypothetical protein